MGINTGVDMIEISRISTAIDRWGNRFLERIYTPQELGYARGRPERLAARFAAKEATMKALGTGRNGVGWKEIEVTRVPGGPPQIILHGRAVKKAEQLGLRNFSISITHCQTYALATVIGETF